MKLSELSNIVDGITVLRDGFFSSFGFCETQGITDLLVYINRDSYVDKAKKESVSCIMTTQALADYYKDLNTGLCIADNPSKLFFQAHNYCAKNHILYHECSYRTIIGDDCLISPFAIISEKNVTIGKRCVIEAGAIINENVTIGDDCVIGSNTVVGTRGLEFYRDGNESVYMEHVGGVRIGNNVEIFSNTTVAAGLIEPTQIHDHVKIDNLVHIGHSDIIGENTFIVSGTKLCRSVHIGKRVSI